MAIPPQVLSLLLLHACTDAKRVRQVFPWTQELTKAVWPAYLQKTFQSKFLPAKEWML